MNVTVMMTMIAAAAANIITNNQKWFYKYATDFPWRFLFDAHASRKDFIFLDKINVFWYNCDE